MTGQENGNGRVKFEPTITWGNIISVAAIVCTVSAAWANLAAGQARVEATLAWVTERVNAYQADHDALTRLQAEMDSRPKGSSWTTDGQGREDAK